MYCVSFYVSFYVSLSFYVSFYISLSFYAWCMNHPICLCLYHVCVVSIILRMIHVYHSIVYSIHVCVLFYVWHAYSTMCVSFSMCIILCMCIILFMMCDVCIISFCVWFSYHIVKATCLNYPTT